LNIPSSMAGLLLFTVLLLPGFAYSATRARRSPERESSTLRETVVIVTTSLTAIVVVGAIFAVLRLLFPRATPDVGRLLFDTHAYLRAHYVSVGWWGFGLLVLAVLGSLGLAAAQTSERLRRVSWLKWFALSPDRSSMSSWWLAFTVWNPDEFDMHLGCSLDDGSYVCGRLFSYSQLGGDVADRDLTLVPPIGMRAKGRDSVEPMENVGLVTVSARHLVTMTVTYVPKSLSTDPPWTLHQNGPTPAPPGQPSAPG
jgi:hypothetical protein